MGMEKEIINVSVIIPVFNTGNYLIPCVESLKYQTPVLEIIMVDDGSTDGSGNIIDALAQKDQGIKVIRQANQGPSAARNRGMDEATGEYIFFLDSDDRIIDHSLDFLYAEASKHRADVVMGNAVFCYPDGKRFNPYRNIAGDITGIPLTGKQCFAALMQTSAFAPMPFNYLCRREFLQSRQLRFEDTLYEDELWTPVLFGEAQKMVITNYDFYIYRRKREQSTTYNNDPVIRRHALFYITGRLKDYADGFMFEGDDREFKSWLYVKIFELYYFAFDLLSKTRDSSFDLPPHHLYCREEITDHLTEAPRRMVSSYYMRSVKALQEYGEWLRSEWVTNMQRINPDGKTIVLNAKRQKANLKKLQRP